MCDVYVDRQEGRGKREREERVRTYCQRCCRLPSKRSKCAPSACKLPGSSISRPWLLALLLLVVRPPRLEALD